MFESALYIVSGVAFYGGAHHLHLGTRNHGRHPHVLHAVMFFLLAGFAMASAATANAQSIAQLSLYGKLAVSLGIILCSLLPWFVVLYTRYRHRVLPALLSVAWTMLLLLNLGSTSSLLYQEIHVLNQALPSGQTFSGLHTTPNPWWLLVELSMISTLIFSFHVAFKYYRRYANKIAITLGSGLLILLFTTCLDLMINAGLIQSAYLAPMGFLLFLFITSIVTLEQAVRDKPNGGDTRNRYPLTVNPHQSTPPTHDTTVSWSPKIDTGKRAAADRQVELAYQPLVPAFSFLQKETIKPSTEPVTLESTLHLEPAEAAESDEPVSKVQPAEEEDSTNIQRAAEAVEADDAPRQEVDQTTVESISDSLVDIAVHATMIMNRLKSGHADPEELEALSRKVRTRAIETRRITHRILRPEEKPDRK